METVRKEFATEAEKQNKEVYGWDAKIELLYKRSDKNMQDGIDYADSLIKNDKTIDKWKISELHNFAGEIYYDNNQIDKALKRFEVAESLTFDSPITQANKAGCYTKLGDYKKAMTLLKQASETNSDYQWYIGNLYEIQKNLKKAISQYESLYNQDTVTYSYCKKRILEISKEGKPLMTELNFIDRRKRSYLLLEKAN
jgi:tetratricopeptide (TPR) repeat protein